MSDEETRSTRSYDDNGTLQILIGAAGDNLDRLEQVLDVGIAMRGNRLTVNGPADRVRTAWQALDSLYARALGGEGIERGDIDAAVRMAGEDTVPVVAIKTRKREIKARSPMQARYLETMLSHELVFGLGPAGTGKTYLAVAMAVSMFLQRRVERLILSRPAVEAGERIGFLPGDMRDKVDPYLRPMYDALYDMLPGDEVVRRLDSGEIEVAPLAFMRGRTLANAFVILDEAQNTTPTQMKMFLTRLGENSRMVITGDTSQVDLPLGAKSGLKDAIEVLDGDPAIGQITFTHKDVVRHDLVTRIVRAYDRRDGTLETSTRHAR
ncbi:phosphate starvation-inducible protein PhoH [Rhodospirillum rubrum]|uniref:PhoH family protein n=1 Tax=Rhodospirillum rubrum TaxID=1085 RepID=UPI001908E074|nr:PhoH family protein [Rhodospirillum rubrum]MBK1664667.1 phosphate starvation-inducible protein PhoH [Rhodospirillum rubrum]MBK1677764.1 phosphate starvation-inducible protein PhoH [Rhodospirillum rubrum]